MKNIDRVIVWVSVKMWNIFFFGFFIFSVLTFIGEKNEIFDVKLIFCILISFALISHINHTEDELYQKFWPEETEDLNKLFEIRGRSVWLPLFLGSIILFFIK